MKKMRLALIAGGKSAEREVSLKSGEQVYKALDKNKYDIRRYDPASDLTQLVQDAPQLDVALIIMHGRGGEDGTVQGLLELLEVPYQGSGVLASAASPTAGRSRASRPASLAASAAGSPSGPSATPASRAAPSPVAPASRR